MSKGISKGVSEGTGQGISKGRPSGPKPSTASTNAGKGGPALGVEKKKGVVGHLYCFLSAVLKCYS